jgi:adenylate kinase family enzyme
MPLKMSFVGDSLSGKTALAQKLIAKYGITLINPVQIINEAF